MEESQSQRPARRCITAADKAYALVCCPSMSPNTIEQNICFFVVVIRPFLPSVLVCTTCRTCRKSVQIPTMMQLKI